MDEENMIVPDNAAEEQITIAPAPGEREGVLLGNAEEPEAVAEPDDGTGESEPKVDDIDGGEQGVTTETPTPTSENRTAEPPRVEPVNDPGDTFVSKTDYSFDITLADGTVFKITKPEDIRQLPADADFGTASNMFEAQTALNKMTIGLDQEQREWEANKQAHQAQKAQTEAAEARVATMIAEINYLETKGKLPPVDKQYENADWSNPDIAKQPGVKERIELLNYRDVENKQRTALGLSPMSILEAHLQMQSDAVVQAENAKKKQDGEIRKARGAMVGGSGASTVPNTPEGYMIGTVQDPRSINNYI